MRGIFVSKLWRGVWGDADREDCRRLLANVEFLAALTAPRGSGLYSRFWPWLFRGMVVVFLVAVLLLVQVNALRYQSDLITWVQRAALALDLAGAPNSIGAVAISASIAARWSITCGRARRWPICARRARR